MSAFQSTFDSLRGFPRRLSDAAREVRRTASLAGAAMLAALSLVLNQFTIAVSQFLEIGFSFLAAGTCRVPVRPVAGRADGHRHRRGWATFCGPTAAFFPASRSTSSCWAFYTAAGCTKNPCPCGARSAPACPRCSSSTWCLTPLWLNIMYGNAFVISGMRLIKNAVKLPLDTALLYFLLKAVETHRKKAL